MNKYVPFKESSFLLVDRIAHILMLKSFFSTEVGLYNGQMGVVLTMSYAFHKTGKRVYLDFAYDLLDEMLKKYSQGFSNQLCKRTMWSSLGYRIFDSEQVYRRR